MDNFFHPKCDHCHRNAELLSRVKMFGKIWEICTPCKHTLIYVLNQNKEPLSAMTEKALAEPHNPPSFFSSSFYRGTGKDHGKRYRVK